MIQSGTNLLKITRNGEKYPKFPLFPVILILTPYEWELGICSYSRTAEEKKASITAIVEEVRNDYALIKHITRESVCYRYLVWATVVIIGLYFVSPVDFLPEAHLGLLGFLDDLAIFLLGLWLLRALVERYIRLTQRRARNEWSHSVHVKRFLLS